MKENTFYIILKFWDDSIQNDRLPPCMYPSEKSSDILCTAFRILPKVDK